MISRRQWLERLSVPALGVGLLSPMIARGSPLPSVAGDALAGAKVYNIRDYGAVGDGTTLNTKAIQAAIDACFSENGGTVLVPAGDFITGTIALKSNVTLHVAVQGRLLGSAQRADYTTGKNIPAGNGNVVMIYAAGAKNISIEGHGTIDGNGAAFFTGHGDNTGPGEKKQGTGNVDRPHLLIFYQCTNLKISDTFFTRSAYHCIRILHCTQVHIDGVRIYNRVNKNNDGFHFNDSRYVHLSNCDVMCQDDACALFGSNQFVTVTNCTFSTRWSVFRFGGGEAQNITVSNCVIYDTYGCPIKISASKARIENLTFSNIVMKNVTGPIGIGFGRKNAETEQHTDASFVRNLVFNGIRATVVTQPINHPDIPFDVKVYDGEQHSCITLNAMGNAYLENVSFTDVHVLYAGGGTAELAAKKDIPEITAEYFGVWATAPVGPPAYGLYARNVRGLTLQNVRFTVDKPDLRPAVVFDRVSDATINGFSAQGNSEAAALLRFNDSSDILVSASRVLTPAKVFLRVEGAASQGIIVDGGDLRKAGIPLAFENGASTRAATLRA